MSKKVIVWLTVDEEHEAEFTRWYQEDYIPRFVNQIPGILSVSRWKIPGKNTYLTMYDLDPATSEADLLAALRDPGRQADREEWNQWEHNYLSDFRDGFFEQTFEFTP